MTVGTKENKTTTQDLFCSDCMSLSSHGFKKVIALKKSGLHIYLHQGEESKNYGPLEKTKKNTAEKSTQLGIFILHNDSGHDLRRPDYAMEMCQLRTRCFPCSNIVKRVRSLLGNLNFIRENQVIGICEHCKRNPGSCERCQNVVKKFLDNKSELHVEKQVQFKSWLSKLNRFLQYVLDDKNLDRGQLMNDPSAMELEILLQELKRPLQLRRLRSTFFPTDLAQMSSMAACNDEMIDELIAKIKPGDSKKPTLEEQEQEVPPLGEDMQLLSKEYQKGTPRRLPSLTNTMSKKRLRERMGQNSVSKNQSEDKQTKHYRISSYETKGEKNKTISEKTTLGSTSNVAEKNNASKIHLKDSIPRNVTEFHRKKKNKKELHKSISETSGKGSSNLFEKVNVSKTQSKDNVSNVTETHGKKAPKTDKNKADSERKKDSTANVLENSKASKTQSKDNQSNVTETNGKIAFEKDENKAFAEITSSDSSSNQHEKDQPSKNQFKDKSENLNEPHSKNDNIKEKKQSELLLWNEGSISKLIRNLIDADSEENKNSERLQAKERDDEKKQKKTISKKQLSSTGKGIEAVKLRTYANQNRKNIQNTTNPYANVELPSVKIEDNPDYFSFDSFFECGQQNPDLITEMIESTKLVKYDPQYKKNMLILSEEDENQTLPDLFVNTAKKKQMPSSAGVLQYKLSDKTFISKGYTILPVIKVMKRINVYKMKPVNPHFNWFERNKQHGTKNYYETGEILAEIKENGTGRWFYKNGRIALDYYNAEDVNSGRRYVLYSSGEDSNQAHGARLKELKNKHQVLGVFDLLGNGVVYDLHGNERIKYNQTEGIIIDSKIAPVGRWKWHSLNDPPVLESLVIDNYDPTYCIDKLHHPQQDHTEKLNRRNQNPEVLQTELQIFAKQKANKMLQKFKPFSIRMKAIKISDMFSLKIVDQAKIYLRFRHERTSMRINLGLYLVSNEMVDTDTSEVGGVATPYDQLPPRTSSIANIQHKLQHARNSQGLATASKTSSTYLHSYL